MSADIADRTSGSGYYRRTDARDVSLVGTPIITDVQLSRKKGIEDVPVERKTAPKPTPRKKAAAKVPAAKKVAKKAPARRR